MALAEDYNENYGDGWIKLFRSIRNHWLWDHPEKLKWWIDILLEVNHTGKKVAIGYELFDCSRGQSVMSLSNWAKRWRVSKDQARNFLVLLQKDKMISRENLGKTTRLTVCNYDSYQHVLHDSQTASKRHPNGTSHKQEGKELKKEKEYIYSPFYDKHLQSANGEYLNYVKFMHGENELNRALNKCLKMNDQLKPEKFNELLLLSGKKNKNMRDVILDIENHDKKYTSFSRTLTNWINR